MPTKPPAKSKPASKSKSSKPTPKPKAGGLLSPEAEKALLAKMRKAEYTSEVSEALEKRVPVGVATESALWDLAMRGKLPLGRIPVVEVLTRYPAPSPEGLVALWSRFKPEWIEDHALQLPGVPSFLFTIVYKAIEKDPAPWVTAASSLPEPLDAVVWLELHELHAAEPSAETMADLHARLLADPFAPSMTSVVANLEILGLDAETIARTLLPRLPADRRPDPESIEVLLRHATPVELARILGVRPPEWHDAGLVGRILSDRRDGVGDLLMLGRTVRERFGRNVHNPHPDELVQSIVDVALERCREMNEVPPPELDELLTFTWEEQSYASPALATLPRERLHAAIRRAFETAEQPWQRQRAFPSLRFAYDEALLGEVIAAARASAEGSCSRANQEPISMGMIGPRAIPAFERALAAARVDTSFERDYKRNCWVTQLRKAIAVALLEGARAGDPVEERFDSLLGPHPECLDWSIIDEVFNGSHLLGELLERLPEPRAKAIVDAWISADPSGNLDIHGRIERELTDSRKGLLAPAEPLIQRLRRLVSETGLEPDTRIYVLELQEELDPSNPNRVCGEPAGLAGERWPRLGGERMEHVFTLDLDQAPELRALAPELAAARAMALFISSRDENEAYEHGTEETALCTLSTEELEAGHGADGDSFLVHPLDVPAAVFCERREGSLGELRSAISQLHGRALGAPFWIQYDEGDGEPLLLQFDKGFASVNLGDCGLMYVFPDTAFWQCH